MAFRGRQIYQPAGADHVQPLPVPQLVLIDLAADVRDGGLCGLEVGGINPLLSGMRYFGSEFDAAVAPGSAQPASAAQRGTNA